MGIYTALVTFERTELHSSVLPDEMQGACGYMAVSSPSRDAIFQVIERSLAEVELRLIGVDDVIEVSRESFPQHLDEHLVSNLKNWEQDKSVVWGTIHTYYADGEA